MCILICIVNFMLGMAHFWSGRKEKQAEIMMDDCFAPAAKFAECIRDGKPKMVEAKQIVPGDIVLVKSDQMIPADVVLFECSEGMKVNQSALTGEYGDQGRSAKHNSHNIFESPNVAFFGTECTEGYGKGIVIRTGDDTALARCGGGQ